MSDSRHIDELLCYATYYINNSCRNNIKRIVCNFYSQEDIIASKKLLWSLSSEFLEPYKERKTTNQRSSADANVNDIFEALLKLDSVDKLPSFVAKKMDNLPNREPEELNLMTMIKRISKIESKQNDFKELVLKHECDLQNTKDAEINTKVNDLNVKVAKTSH